MNTQREHDACGVALIVNATQPPSHRILALGLEGLENMEDRGGIDADGETGDGAGVLIQFPRAFFADEVQKLTGTRPAEEELAVGFFFLPQEPEGRRVVYEIAQAAFDHFGIRVFGWRWVPHNASILSLKARDSMPALKQVLLGRSPDWNDDEYERRLYLARRMIDAKVTEAGRSRVYIPSLSSQIIVYKGLFRAEQVRLFYLDLQDGRFVTQFCISHRRFCTNVLEDWALAHPFPGGIAANGEINTLLGNRGWTRAREQGWISRWWGPDVELLRPLLRDDESDSASLDRMFELFVRSGHDPIYTWTTLLPPPWENKTNLSPELRAFFECQAANHGIWDGPAFVAWVAKNMVGGKLDRNGLRPARGKLYRDGTIVLASVAGIVDLPEAEVVSKWRIKPGQMIAINLKTGTFYDNAACREHVAGLKPYANWVEQNMITLDSMPITSTVSASAEHSDPDALTRQQISFGWSQETVQKIVAPMAVTGKEPVYSMGNNWAAAVLSLLPKPPSWYFNQRFAHVTNPAIDSLREAIVMSLWMYLGRRGPWLEESPAHVKVVKLNSPFLTADQLMALERLDDPAFRSVRISCLFPKSVGAEGYDQALAYLCEQAEAAIHAGAAILILTDRDQDEYKVPIPMLQAVGTIHHYLIDRGLRMQADLVVVSGTACDAHAFALLIGYGASAVHPYLACATIQQAARAGMYGAITPEQALQLYQHAIEAGLLKIIAKMGVSTIRSYHGAQLFSATGLGHAIIMRSFRGTVSPVEGIDSDQVARDALLRHRLAFADETAGVTQLTKRGDLKSLPKGKGGEIHGDDAAVVKAMYAFRANPNPETFAAFQRAVDVKPGPVHLRDLWTWASTVPVPVEEVEPIIGIVRRFRVSSMSYGALSDPAHRTLAEGANRVGARSGSGEGGEDPTRFGTDTNSSVKQIAPGRFGVTPEYVLSALVIEEKMGQGAKPGEGGQVPGNKVTEPIAEIRRGTPGVGIFSPSRHYDFNSVEDGTYIAGGQRQLNPDVSVSMKLVSTPGVDTITIGCVKTGADIVLIAGKEGGTGAAPLGSIMYAGDELETGLAETHKLLVARGWRKKVVLEVDGGLRTARDVVIAGILGAELFGFGTLALESIGCVKKDECHLGSCPVGITTQDPALVAKFPGTPENVVDLFTYLAEGVRAILAELGYRRFDDIIGRAELLQRRPLVEFPESIRPDIERLDLSRLTVPVGRLQRDVHPADFRRPPPPNPVDDQIAVDYADVLAGQGQAVVERLITSRDHYIGTRLAGVIARRCGDKGLPIPDALTLKLTGSAGQCFGLYLVPGLRLELTGEANDGVGKSMCGGLIIIRPPPEARFDWSDSVIIGNVALYGATGGRLFVPGQAGEWFAVRNSGAVTVVEGIGDHGCMFMTRGLVVSIGDALGWNFGSGSSGACSMVLYDQFRRARRQMSPDVTMTELAEATAEEIAQVRALIEEHYRFTGSPRAYAILDQWWKSLDHFRLVRPNVR